MKVLVTGAHGQVGWELSRGGARNGFDILGLDRTALDITDQSAVKRTVERSEAALVVNGAAYTAVDQAESEPELAFALRPEFPLSISPQTLSLTVRSKVPTSSRIRSHLLMFTEKAKPQGRWR